MNINDIRQEFQIFRNEPNLAYLDNAAMALKPDRVIKAVDDYYLNYGVNVHRGIPCFTLISIALPICFWWRYSYKTIISLGGSPCSCL